MSPPFTVGDKVFYSMRFRSAISGEILVVDEVLENKVRARSYGGNVYYLSFKSIEKAQDPDNHFEKAAAVGARHGWHLVPMAANA